MLSPKRPSRRYSLSWRNRLENTIIPSVISGVMLILLILGNMCYLYGTTFRQQSKVHALRILLVDFDQGEIGTAVTLASQKLQRSQFPTVELGSVSEYPEPKDLKQSVCNARYWAALYVKKGASQNLADVLNGSRREYDPASAVTYIYNQARYSVIADSYLINGLTSIVSASRTSYYESSSANATLATLDLGDQNGVAAYLNPISASSDLIQPTEQVSRVFFNTVNTVIPPLAQFFFILALNGIAAASGFHVQCRARDVWLFRFCISKIYTSLSGIAMMGYVWAFRETWGLTGSDFAKCWLLFWFLMDIQFQVLETLIGSFLPIQFTPFFVFTWIITNVASTIFPFEIMPGGIGLAMLYRRAHHIRSWCKYGLAAVTRRGSRYRFSLSGGLLDMRRLLFLFARDVWMLD